MPWNGSGSGSRTNGAQTGSTLWADNEAAANKKITGAKHDTHDQDLLNMILNAIAKDGQNAATANLPMGGFKHTDVANGTARTHYAAIDQLQDNEVLFSDASGTVDAITATFSPAITAVVDGMEVCVRAAGANTSTTPTFAPATSGITARTITKHGGQALVAGDIFGANHDLRLRYDSTNTRWELLNPVYGPIASTTEALTGTDAKKIITADALAALWEKGSDIASSGTISIGEGGYFDVTGTTTITDIDFGTDKAGRVAWLQFDGALTLTHGANLILPGAANIVTVAGDIACFVSEGSDTVRCVLYRRSGDAPTTIAVQSDMETATSLLTTVTPGRVKYSPNTVKGFSSWDAATANNASTNVSSLTDNGTGDTSVNWSTAFSSAAYANAGMASRAAYADAAFMFHNADPTTTVLRVKDFNTSTAEDGPDQSVMSAGDF